MTKRIIVISGFSGVGKGTLVRQLLGDKRDVAENLKLWLSVSDTTRKPRNDGGDNYNFISAEEYNSRIEKGFYLEHNEYGSHGYGTPIMPALTALERGNTLLLEIDYNGMIQVRDYFRDSDVSVTTVFIWAEGNELFERLDKRGDSPIEIKKRLSTACMEASHIGEYDCLIKNSVFNDAAQDLWMVVTREVYPTENSFDYWRFNSQIHSALKAFNFVGSAEEA